MLKKLLIGTGQLIDPSSPSNANLGAILFARLDSSRLYGKVLADIEGQPLLDHVLARTQQICPAMNIVLATTDRVIDAPLVDWAKEKQIKFHCGEFKNVTARAVSCAKAFMFSGFIRICADRPFIDPITNTKLIDIYKSKRLDLATNALTRTFPTGAMAEVVRVSALEKVLALTRDPIDLEHVTRYIYRNATTFCLENLYSNDPTLKDVSLAIDTKEDLARTRWVFRRLADPAKASLAEVIAYTRTWYHK